MFDHARNFYIEYLKEIGFNLCIWDTFLCLQWFYYLFSNEPTCEERTDALAVALAKIFWRAGEKRKAVVCL
jgi:hypothetical protein